MNTTPTALLSSTALLITAVTVTLLALLALLFARRGWRVGTEPRCRQCGFDLSGKPATSTRCPECGADLATPLSIVIGHRVRKRRLAWAAGIVLVPALFVSALLGYGHVQQIDWRRHLPVSMLIREARGPAGVDADAAFAEISRRIRSNALSAGQWQELLDAAIVAQGDLTRAWDPRWIDALDRGHTARQTTAAQWEQYLRNAVTSAKFRLKTRPHVQRGDVCPVEFDSDRPRFLYETGEAFFSLESFTLDDTIDLGGWLRESRRDDPTQLFATSTDFLMLPNPSIGLSFDDYEIASVPAGRHRIVLRSTLRIYAKSSRAGFNPASVPPATPPLLTMPLVIEGAFDLVEPSAATATSFVDPARREEVRSRITLGEVSRLGDTVTVKFDVAAGPIPLAFTPFLRPGGTERLLEGLSMTSGPSGSDEKSVSARFDCSSLEGGPPKQAELILYPDRFGLQRRFDPAPGWGEEVVFELTIPESE